MTRIEHTNIIIDNFSIAKKETNRTYTHILTHIHTDHLKGLHDGWSYGPIYCTEFTKALLLYKFPNISNIITLPLQTPIEIKMSATLSVTITFFDANHCIGSGYMGRVLYTGDMRFDRDIFKNYSKLYPADKWNQKFQRSSQIVDVLYLDNTFLKKKFNFPPKQVVLKMAIDYIQSLLDLNKHKRIFIGLDSFGKQEVLVEIATHFKMYIVVDQQRYELIRQTPLNLELFTTIKQQGFIEVVRKDKLYSSLKEVEDSIGIILSGWVNHPTYRFGQTIYCLPYSLHSNYEEIHQFINSIRPSFIYPIVHQFPDQNKFFYAGKQDISKRDLMFNQQLFQEEEGNYKPQIEELRSLYISPLTEEYKILSENILLQKKIDELLRPPNLPNLFTSEKVTPLNMQIVERKKYRISNNRNQMQINRLKNQIKLKKKIIEGLSPQIVELIDAKSIQYPDSTKSKIQVIAIEDQEQLQLMKADIIEIDPLYQPIYNSKNNSRNKSLGGNEKKKITRLLPLTKESAMKQLKPILQINHNRPKKKQEVSEAIKIFKKENILKDPRKQNQELKEKELNLLTEIAVPTRIPIQCQFPKKCCQGPFEKIDMDMVGKRQVVEIKEDSLMHLKRSPQQIYLMTQMFQGHKACNQ